MDARRLKAAECRRPPIGGCPTAVLKVAACLCALASLGATRMYMVLGDSVVLPMASYDTSYTPSQRATEISMASSNPRALDLADAYAEVLLEDASGGLMGMPLATQGHVSVLGMYHETRGDPAADFGWFWTIHGATMEWGIGVNATNGDVYG